MTSQLVLVVDDSAQNLLVASRHLEAAGYRVLTASSGEHALELLATNHPDLIILDVLMPGMGGFETCRRIRATPRIASMPIMFLTALGDRDATAPALDAGGDDLLPKPFTRAELLLRVRALIRQHRRFAERQQIVLDALARLRAISADAGDDVARRLDVELARVEASLG